MRSTDFGAVLGVSDSGAYTVSASEEVCTLVRSALKRVDKTQPCAIDVEFNPCTSPKRVIYKYKPRNDRVMLAQMVVNNIIKKEID